MTEEQVDARKALGERILEVAGLMDELLQGVALCLSPSARKAVVALVACSRKTSWPRTPTLAREEVTLDLEPSVLAELLSLGLGFDAKRGEVYWATERLEALKWEIRNVEQGRLNWRFLERGAEVLTSLHDAFVAPVGEGS